MGRRQPSQVINVSYFYRYLITADFILPDVRFCQTTLFLNMFDFARFLLFLCNLAKSNILRNRMSVEIEHLAKSNQPSHKSVLFLNSDSRNTLNRNSSIFESFNLQGFFFRLENKDNFETIISITVRDILRTVSRNRV